MFTPLGLAFCFLPFLIHHCHYHDTTLAREPWKGRPLTKTGLESPLFRTDDSILRFPLRALGFLVFRPVCSLTHALVQLSRWTAHKGHPSQLQVVREPCSGVGTIPCFRNPQQANLNPPSGPLLALDTKHEQQRPD